MRKYLIGMYVMLIFSYGYASGNTLSKVQGLISKDIHNNKQLIFSLSADLSDSEKLLLYQKNSKDAKEAKMMNGIIGLFGIGGMGSLKQGDYLGGSLIFSGQLIGTGLIIGGVFLFWSGAVGSTAAPPDPAKEKGGIAMMVIGGLLDLASWSMGLIRPEHFSSEYNAMLRSALNMEPPDMISWNIRPHITTTKLSDNERSTVYGLSFSVFWN